MIREALQPAREVERVLASRLRYHTVQREVQARVQDHRMEDIVRTVPSMRY